VVENRAVVIGLAGKFWLPLPNMILLTDAKDFIDFDRPGFSKTAFNFLIETKDQGGVVLSTETRVRSFGGVAKVLFLFYWAIISPYSAWIRVEMLNMVKIEAESGAK
jgi:hypothetical protein